MFTVSMMFPFPTYSFKIHKGFPFQKFHPLYDFWTENKIHKHLMKISILIHQIIEFRYFLFFVFYTNMLLLIYNCFFFSKELRIWCCTLGRVSVGVVQPRKGPIILVSKFKRIKHLMLYLRGWGLPNLEKVQFDDFKIQKN